jgi:hypothetical protein
MKAGNTPLHAHTFIRSIVRKVALIHRSPLWTGYAGGTWKILNAFGERQA